MLCEKLILFNCEMYLLKISAENKSFFQPLISALRFSCQNDAIMYCRVTKLLVMFRKGKIVRKEKKLNLSEAFTVNQLIYRGKIDDNFIVFHLALACQRFSIRFRLNLI